MKFTIPEQWSKQMARVEADAGDPDVTVGPTVGGLPAWLTITTTHYGYYVETDKAGAPARASDHHRPESVILHRIAEWLLSDDGIRALTADRAKTAALEKEVAAWKRAVDECKHFDTGYTPCRADDWIECRVAELLKGDGNV